MAKQSLLLVDSDARSLRVLEVSLKKAGFNVTTAVNGRDALDKVQTAQPDLIISDTEMPEMDGFSFCEELKTNGQWADIPFIFLTKETAIEHKIRGLELGVEDYLTKPIYIKEILTRIRILLQKHQRARLEGGRGNRTRFAGRISDMGVVDLIQTIEVSRKSGLIHFRAGEDRRGVLYFRGGQVIDAEAGTLQGVDAVYRLLTWNDGEFEVIFRSVRRKDVIQMSSQALLMEGMRRLDEWGRLLEQLPPLDTRFEVDTNELAERLADLPDEYNAILKLFDGRRTAIEVVDSSSYGDLECLEGIAKLYFEGLVMEVDEPERLRVEKLRQKEEEAAGLVLVGGSEADDGTLADHELFDSKSPASGDFGPRRAPRVGDSRVVYAIEDDESFAAQDDALLVGQGDDVAPEQTISEEELDMTDVDVAPQPQTSLVEEAIGAAAPIEPVEVGESYAMPLSHTTEEHVAESGEASADEGNGEDDDDIEIFVEMPAQGDFEEPSSEDPAMAGGSEQGISVVSSEGAEVAMASGEFQIPEPVRDPEPARELVTIVPSRGEDKDSSQPPKRPSYLTFESLFGDEKEEENAGDSAENAAGAATGEAAAERTAAGKAGRSTEFDSEEVTPVERLWPTKKREQSATAMEPAARNDASDDTLTLPVPGRRRWMMIAAALAALVVIIGLASRGKKSSGTGDRDAQVTSLVTARVDAGAIHTGVTPQDGTPTVAKPPVDARLPIDAGLPVDAHLPIDAALPVDARLPIDASLPIDARRVSAPVPVDAGVASGQGATKAMGHKEYVAEARRAYRKKKHDEALALLDLALAERRSTRALTLKGDILLDKGDTAGALEAIDQAIKLSSSYAQAWLIKGQIHLAQKDDSRAKEAFERYLELEPQGKDADLVRTLLGTMK